MDIQAESKKGLLYVVSGPSGSGKSTICRELVKRTDVHLSVSACTRRPGEQEVDGKDYYFISEPEFEAKIKANEFLEYARVFDHYYGTPARPVMDKINNGETVILEIDVQGAEQVFNRYPEAIGLLILPPDKESLQERLSRRGRDDPETIRKRLAKAQWEIEKAQSSKNFKYTIINKDLETAIQDTIDRVTGK